MSDLISRQDALDEIRRFSGYLDKDMINRIHIGLNRLPSAQPEIIRCEDCKYRGGLSGFYCDIVKKLVGVNSFCSWAERRTDE